MRITPATGGDETGTTRADRLGRGSSGSAVVQVSETLDAEIDGSGSIRYVGAPQVTQRIAGAGIMAPR